MHRVGLITDLQYADKDDGHEFISKRPRRFRRSLAALRSAVSRWRSEEVDRVFQLGDLIENGGAFEDSPIVSVMESLPVPWHNSIGNHDRNRFNESAMRLWIGKNAGVDLGNRNYYSISPTPAVGHFHVRGDGDICICWLKNKIFLKT